jgi:hypothetical protein
MEKRPGQGAPPEAAVATSACTVRRVCDFCSEPCARWVFPCAPITRSVAGGPLYMAFGSRWYACDECAPIVDRGDWKRLMKRVRRLSTDDLSSHIVMTDLVALWLTFENRRTGPAEAVS